VLVWTFPLTERRKSRVGIGWSMSWGGSHLGRPPARLWYYMHYKRLECEAVSTTEIWRYEQRSPLRMFLPRVESVAA
jgi:hypothetical protein